MCNKEQDKAVYTVHLCCLLSVSVLYSLTKPYSSPHSSHPTVPKTKRVSSLETALTTTTPRRRRRRIRKKKIKLNIYGCFRASQTIANCLSQTHPTYLVADSKLHQVQIKTYIYNVALRLFFSFFSHYTLHWASLE